MVLLADRTSLDFESRFDSCDCGLGVNDEENDPVVVVGRSPKQRRCVPVTCQIGRLSPLATVVRPGSKVLNGVVQMTVFVILKV